MERRQRICGKHARVRRPWPGGSATVSETANTIGESIAHGQTSRSFQRSNAEISPERGRCRQAGSDQAVGVVHIGLMANGATAAPSEHPKPWERRRFYATLFPDRNSKVRSNRAFQ